MKEEGIEFVTRRWISAILKKLQTAQRILSITACGASDPRDINVRVVKQRIICPLTSERLPTKSLLVQNCRGLQFHFCKR